MQNLTDPEIENSTVAKTIATQIFDHAIATLTHEDNQLIECGLTCQIPLDIYQIIEKQGLFNLKPELCSQSVSFTAYSDITLQATLHPDRHPDLSEHATTPETVLQYLQELSHTQPDHPLLNFDNWFVLSAQQGDLDYTTLWATLNPSKLAAGQIPEAELTESLSKFFVNIAETEFNKAFGQFGQDILDDFSNLFQLDRQQISNHPITNKMVAFFTNDDWTFTKIQGQPILQMGYQGENGQFICYARANENPQQFAFYSIFPMLAPEERKLAIAEFITRANYGMVIGNFEFNFSNGEILYKTSIDVEGDRLTATLIKRLVYTNIAIADQYLPSIQAIIDGKSPTDAIQAIEQQYLD
jgi:hypothetical protein